VLIIPLTSRGQANGRLTFRFTEERDGFGKLVKHKRKVRPGINPSTKQKIKIHAKTVLQFRVAKAAKGPVPPISASTPTDRIASCSALTRNWYLLPDINVITQFGAANLEIFEVATEECEPAQLGQGERTASRSPN
jgi:hypothetical protein